MLKVLSASEMKQVRGGAQSSRYCAEGQLLYTCATGYANGFISRGSACGGNASEVAGRIMEQRIFEDPLLAYEGINVKC